MKKLKLAMLWGLCVWGAFCISADGQAAAPAENPAVAVARPVPARTRMEAFAERKGAIIIRGFSEIASITGEEGTGVRITAVELSDARGNREQGVLIEVSQGQGHDAGSYIDYDELGGVMEALDTLQRMDRAASKMLNVEGRFRTRGDVEFTNFSTGGVRMGATRCTQVSSITGEAVSASAYFGTATLGALRTHLTTAKQALDQTRDAK